MAELFWARDIENPEAPTVSEIRAGEIVRVESAKLVPYDGDWHKETITIYPNYRWSTPIKFPTTPETVCFMTGLAR